MALDSSRPVLAARMRIQPAAAGTRNSSGAADMHTPAEVADSTLQAVVVRHTEWESCKCMPLEVGERICTTLLIRKRRMEEDE